MSLIISSTSSNPTESLTKFSLIPNFFFHFLKVCDELLCMGELLMFLNLLNYLKYQLSLSLFKNLKEFFSPFFFDNNSKLKIVPPSFICFFAKLN